MKMDIRPFRKLGKAYTAKTDSANLYIKKVDSKFVLLEKADVGYITLGKFTTLTQAIQFTRDLATEKST